MGITIFGFKSKVVILLAMFAIVLMGIQIGSVHYVKYVALDAMEPRGQYNSEVDQLVKDACNRVKLDYSKVTINATSRKVNYGERLFVEVSYPLTIDIGIAKKDFTIRTSNTVSAEGVVR